MVLKVNRLVLPSALVLAFASPSCETEFSVNGNYQITPIVIGLLDHTDSTHIIKITKAFLGDGDNLVYAQNPDSNYFVAVDAWIREIEPLTGDYTGREWNLHDSIITNKSTDGAFYAPYQKVYVFYEDSLLSDMEYELTADLEEGAHTITAKTGLIDGFGVASTILQPTWKINFASATVDEDKDYKFWKFLVTEGTNAAVYNYKYTMNYRETYTDLTTADFSIERNDGDVIQESPSTPGGHTQTFAGLDFYLWVADVIEAGDPDVMNRRLLGIDLKVSIAHRDLDQFMDVGAPVTGIVQNKPEFTNITGGLGLFSSRLIYEVKNYKLDPNSIKELCTGQHTQPLVFCSWYTDDAAESYYCP